MLLLLLLLFLSLYLYTEHKSSSERNKDSFVLLNNLSAYKIFLPGFELRSSSHWIESLPLGQHNPWMYSGSNFRTLDLSTLGRVSSIQPTCQPTPGIDSRTVSNLGPPLSGSCHKRSATKGNPADHCLGALIRVIGDLKLPLLRIQVNCFTSHR